MLCLARKTKTTLSPPDAASDGAPGTKPCWPPSRYRALHTAARSGEVEVVRLLLDSGVLPTSETGRNALRRSAAVAGCNGEMARRLRDTTNTRAAWTRWLMSYSPKQWGAWAEPITVNGRRYTVDEWILWWAQYNADQLTDWWIQAYGIKVTDEAPIPPP